MRVQAMFKPDIIVPVGSTPPTIAEHRIQYAVVERAWDDLRDKSDRIRAEALAWFETDGELSYPYSLASICDVLGIDISAVRQAARARVKLPSKRAEAAERLAACG